MTRQTPSIPSGGWICLLSTDTSSSLVICGVATDPTVHGSASISLILTYRLFLLLHHNSSAWPTYPATLHMRYACTHKPPADGSTRPLLHTAAEPCTLPALLSPAIRCSDELLQAALGRHLALELADELLQRRQLLVLYQVVVLRSREGSSREVGDTGAGTWGAARGWHVALACVFPGGWLVPLPVPVIETMPYGLCMLLMAEQRLESPARVGQRAALAGGSICSQLLPRPLASHVLQRAPSQRWAAHVSSEQHHCYSALYCWCALRCCRRPWLTFEKNMKCLKHVLRCASSPSACTCLKCEWYMCAYTRNRRLQMVRTTS
jgi:hypothetical protein